MYEIVEDHGFPVEHEGVVRASESKRMLELGSFPAARMMEVLSRKPDVCGHPSVARITSENMAVLLVPSVIATMATPLRIWFDDPVTAKIPPYVPQVLEFALVGTSEEVVPTLAR